jgi:hypothetical protein
MKRNNKTFGVHSIHQKLPPLLVFFTNKQAEWIHVLIKEDSFKYIMIDSLKFSTR